LSDRAYIIQQRVDRSARTLRGEKALRVRLLGV
jgi:hypothetical protein